MPTSETVLLNDNNRHRRITGAAKFHNAGYFGERVVAGTGENWDISYYNPGGLVLDPLHIGTGTADHPLSTAAVFFQFAPKARLIQLPMCCLISSDPDRCYVKFADTALPVIKEYNVLNQFNSFTQSYNATTKAMYEAAMYEVPNLKLHWSMGNKDGEEYSKITDLECMYGIAACKIMVDGTIVPEGFSSEAITVDFTCPDMIAYSLFATSPNASGSKPSGTSYAAPTCCALSCLVDDFFIDKTGKPLTREAMYRFLKDHCLDIDTEGFDIETGYGFVCLPDPSEIILTDYVDSEVDTPLTPPDSEDENNKEEDDMSKQPEQIRENYKPYETHMLNKDLCQITVIPYQSIKEVGFAQCTQPKETVMSWYNRQDDKPQIVTNGGLFNMSTGTNILSFVDEGKEQNYKANFEGIGVISSNPAALIPGSDSEKDWKDFMSAYPVLVKNGKALTKFDKGNELNYYAARTAIGVTKNGDVIILTVDKSNAQGGMLFSKMADVFEEYGAWYAINLDGGGSVYKMEFGKVTNEPTEARLVDNVFYVKLKEVNDMSENPNVNLDPIVVKSGDYYAHEPIDLKVGVDTSADQPAKVLTTIPVGAMFSINSTMQWNGVTWAVASYNYEIGFIACTGSNFDTIPPLPAIFFTDEGAPVIVDRYESDDNGQYYHVAYKAIDSDGAYIVGDKVDSMYSAESLEYSMYYEGTLVDDTVEGDSDMNITPGEGSGEGDPEEPEFDDYPALYQVNPSMVNTVLNVRSAPINGSVITTLSPGTVVTVLTVENGGEWAKIEYNENGDIGYCAMAYLIYYGESEDDKESGSKPEDPSDEVQEPETPSDDEKSTSNSDEIVRILNDIDPRKNVVVVEMIEDVVAAGIEIDDNRMTNRVDVNIPAGTKLIAINWLGCNGECLIVCQNTNIKYGTHMNSLESMIDIFSHSPIEIVGVLPRVDPDMISSLSGASVVKLSDNLEYMIPSYGEHEDIINLPVTPVTARYGVMIGEATKNAIYFYDDCGVYIVEDGNYEVVGELYETDDEDYDSDDDGASDDSDEYDAYPWLDGAADKDSVNPEYREGVNFAICSELLPLDESGNFNPKAPVTKEELANIIYLICANEEEDTVEDPIE